MTPNPSRRPSVIAVFTDQQRHNSTGVHGNPLGLTPNFDRMAARGIHIFHSLKNSEKPARTSNLCPQRFQWEVTGKEARS